ncbi:hypothetical protein [Desulfogranum mediterraneum]|uniref:hypothetical protein n=1 Tax=Desulfogranum mediterraneum TaxID=160661 RepID=UPI000687ABB0|nr:hypothetical protein [Desulfogranum mediterraneum]
MPHLHRRSYLGRCLYRHCLAVLAILMLCSASPGAAAAAPLNLEQTSLHQTVSLYQRNSCLTSEQIAYGQEILKGLNYTSQRAFRSLCRLPALSFAHCQRAWSLLINHPLSYEQLLSFEQWTALEGVEVEQALEGLPRIQSLTPEAAQAFRATLGLAGITPGYALHLVDLLNTLEPAVNQAVQELVLLEGMSARSFTASLLTISRLRPDQALCAKAFARIPAMEAATMLEALPLLVRLRHEDAWNGAALFAAASSSPQQAWDWLVAFLTLPPTIQEEQLSRFDRSQKGVLLQAFSAAAPALIRKINDLHTVTDRFGRELSSRSLHSASPQSLGRRLERLSPQTRDRFAPAWSEALRAGSSRELVRLLRQATAAERHQLAATLSSANLYALLARGSELYDSSFRDVLVPVLLERISQRFAGDLLYFLRSVDPAELLVADFITSCAQKGKLHSFFPKEHQRQQQVLELVACSAFRDQDALLLFSATMLPLWQVLEPQARSFMLDKMLAAGRRAPAEIGRLIAVIVQYYQQYHPELLSASDSQAIRGLTATTRFSGITALAPYFRTPFGQWKVDGRLCSLSLFYPDDDGRRSFTSFVKLLRANGYSLHTGEGPRPTTKAYRSALDLAASDRPGGIGALFEQLQRHQGTLVCSRTINQVTIHHLLSVYTSPQAQQALLLDYFRQGYEMLIQRGHSYWRQEQLIAPITALREEGRLPQELIQAKQRFLSLGSCGGVRAYTALNHLFAGSVDILATMGTGLAAINNPYNIFLLELVARSSEELSWVEVARQSALIFRSGRGRDYLQPGSLTSLLHKIVNQQNREAAQTARHRSPHSQQG